jgi:hypothetical protein
MEVNITGPDPSKEPQIPPPMNPPLEQQPLPGIGHLPNMAQLDQVQQQAQAYEQLPKEPTYELPGVTLPNMQNLSKVMDQNRAALQLHSKINQHQIQNVSTAYVEENKPFDTQDLAQQQRALAGLQSEHLNLVRTLPQVGEELNACTKEFETTSASLMRLRLPDTKANVNGRALTSSYNVKAYANGILQYNYAHMLASLLPSAEMMEEIKQHCTKANQMDTPALWVNQRLDLETQEHYVYMIRQENEAVIDAWTKSVRHEDRLKADEIMKELFGQELFGKIAQIAAANQTMPLGILIILLSRILEKIREQSRPITSRSIWSGITKEEKPRIVPEITADFLEAVGAAGIRRR